MTTIICNRKGMAADKMCQFLENFTTTKIVRLESGSLVATAGDACKGVQFVKWKNGGDKPEWEDETEFVALELTNGRIFVYTPALEPLSVEDEVYAIGSGAGYALVSYKYTQDLQQSVIDASERDQGTGREVQVEYL